MYVPHVIELRCQRWDALCAIIQQLPAVHRIYSDQHQQPLFLVMPALKNKDAFATFTQILFELHK